LAARSFRPGNSAARPVAGYAAHSPMAAFDKSGHAYLTWCLQGRANPERHQGV